MLIDGLLEYAMLFSIEIRNISSENAARKQSGAAFALPSVAHQLLLLIFGRGCRGKKIWSVISKLETGGDGNGQREYYSIFAKAIYRRIKIWSSTSLCSKPEDWFDRNSGLTPGD